MLCVLKLLCFYPFIFSVSFINICQYPTTADGLVWKIHSLCCYSLKFLHVSDLWPTPFKCHYRKVRCRHRCAVLCRRQSFWSMMEKPPTVYTSGLPLNNSLLDIYDHLLCWSVYACVCNRMEPFGEPVWTWPWWQQLESSGVIRLVKRSSKQRVFCQITAVMFVRNQIKAPGFIHNTPISRLCRC